MNVIMREAPIAARDLLVLCMAHAVSYRVRARVIARRTLLPQRVSSALLLRSRSFLLALMTCCQCAGCLFVSCRPVALQASLLQAVASKVRQLDLGSDAEAASVEKMVAAARKGSRKQSLHEASQSHNPACETFCRACREP